MCPAHTTRQNAAIMADAATARVRTFRQTETGLPSFAAPWPSPAASGCCHCCCCCCCASAARLRFVSPVAGMTANDDGEP